MARPTAFLRRCAARHGEAFTIRLAFDDAPLVLVWHPDAVRAVHAADPWVARRGASPGPLALVAGERSILMADGEAHLRIRRLMLGPFHGERMGAAAPLVRALAEERVGAWPRGRPVALLGELQALTLDVILRVVLGVRDAALAADIRRTFAAASSRPRLAAMGLVPRDLGPRSPWGAFHARLRGVEASLRAVVAERREHPGDDVLSGLIAAGCEVAAALRAGDDELLEGVVRETLRLRPVLTVAPRKLAAPLHLGARVLPAGVHVAPCIYLVHRRGDRYPDPLAWRPERWRGVAAPDGAAWIPFGGGVRRCVGAAFALMEMREVLRVLTARLVLAPERPVPERMRRRGVTLHPGRGARVVLAHR